MFRRSGWALLACLGCGLGDAPGAAKGTGESGSSGGTSGPVTTSGSAGMDSTSSTTTTTSVDTGSAEEGVFILEPDGGSSAYACDVWAQDCPSGEKCMPWKDDGGDSWNATRCSPIDEDAKDVGEACTVENGIDDCMRRAMCWDVESATNMGVCVGFCQGSEANPFCDDPCDSCVIGTHGLLILCLPKCDPIAQDCPEDEACYPVNDTFLCELTIPGLRGVAGEPCEYINVCAAGLFCTNADTVPGCDGATGCCAPYCDAGAVDGCDAMLPGTSCVPWYDEGEVLDGCTGMGIIGACLVAE